MAIRQFGLEFHSKYLQSGITEIRLPAPAGGPGRCVLLTDGTGRLVRTHSVAHGHGWCGCLPRVQGIAHGATNQPNTRDRNSQNCKFQVFGKSGISETRLPGSSWRAESSACCWRMVGWFARTPSRMRMPPRGARISS